MAAADESLLSKAGRRMSAGAAGLMIGPAKVIDGTTAAIADQVTDDESMLQSGMRRVSDAALHVMYPAAKMIDGATSMSPEMGSTSMPPGLLRTADHSIP